MDRSKPRQGSRSLAGSGKASNAGARRGDAGSETQFVESVARAVAILTAFRADDAPLGNSELAERTGLTKPTVSRLTYTMTKCGMLIYNSRFRVYELGPSVHALGYIAARTSGVRQIAGPLMRQLADRANFNIGLGSRDGSTMVYLEAFEGGALVGLRLSGGSRLPILQSAMGRAYLCALESEQRDAILADLEPLQKENWTVLMSKLERARQEFLSQGFCTSIGDWRPDINGLAAPIISPADGQVYAVNLGGPSYLLPEDRIRTELGPKVVDLVKDVEKRMPMSALPLP